MSNNGEQQQQVNNKVKPNKSLSAIRHFIRYAVSSIVYHKLVVPVAPVAPVRVRVPIVKEEGQRKRGNKDEEGQAQIDDGSTNSNRGSCFVERSFYGIDNLKYIDAVDDNEMIKDENGKFTLSRTCMRYAFMYL